MGGGQGAMPPHQSSIKWIFQWKETGFVGTILSLPEVFCGPQICQKCVGDRGSTPDPAGEAHDAPPDPLVGHPLPNPTPSALRRLDCRAIGAQLLWPPM